MVFPVYTTADVAEFSGRDAAAYPSPYTAQGILQATILFQIATALTGFSGDPFEDQILKFGILSMADHLVLQQPYQEALASPFNSESIGSYHYMKTYQRASMAANAVSRGEATGVMWFDMAVAQYGVKDYLDGIPRGGGTELFEHDGIFVVGSMHDNSRFLSPEQLHSIAWDHGPRTLTENPKPQEPVVLGSAGIPDQYDSPTELTNSMPYSGTDAVFFDDPELPSVPGGWAEDPLNPGLYIQQP